MKDRAYLGWIRTLGCIVPGCRQRTPTEAHHFGPRAFSRKAPDRHALPVCAAHHRLRPDAAHSLGRLFCQRHGIDARAEIERLNLLYDGTEAWGDGHPAEGLIEEGIRGGLPDAALDRVANHIARCPECCGRMYEAEQRAGG